MPEFPSLLLASWIKVSPTAAGCPAIQRWLDHYLDPVKREQHCTRAPQHPYSEWPNSVTNNSVVVEVVRRIGRDGSKRQAALLVGATERLCGVDGEVPQVA